MRSVHLIDLFCIKNSGQPVAQKGHTPRASSTSPFIPVPRRVRLDGSGILGPYRAIQEQLRRKLEPVNAFANVILIGHIDKPSDN
jgi:hypothetical protein